MYNTKSWSILFNTEKIFGLFIPSVILITGKFVSLAIILAVKDLPKPLPPTNPTPTLPSPSFQALLTYEINSLSLE